MRFAYLAHRQKHQPKQTAHCDNHSESLCHESARESITYIICYDELLCVHRIILRISLCVRLSLCTWWPITFVVFAHMCDVCEEPARGRSPLTYECTIGYCLSGSRDNISATVCETSYTYMYSVYFIYIRFTSATTYKQTDPALGCFCLGALRRSALCFQKPESNVHTHVCARVCTEYMSVNWLFVCVQYTVGL